MTLTSPYARKLESDRHSQSFGIEVFFSKREQASDRSIPEHSQSAFSTYIFLGALIPNAEIISWFQRKSWPKGRPQAERVVSEKQTEPELPPRMPPIHHTSHEHGNVLVTTVVGLFALVALATLAINQTMAYEAQAKLQNVVDAAALAGISAIRDGGDQSMVTARAQAVGDAHDIRGATSLDVKLAESSIDTGWFHFGSGGFLEEPTEDAVPAVRVDVTLEGNPSSDNTGALKLFLSGVMESLTGSSVARIKSDAIAVVRPRDFVILQDITWSFREEFEYARDADLAFVELLANRDGGLGDRVGVVTFGREAYRSLDFEPVASEAEKITDYLTYDMEVCQDTSSQSGPDGINCRGTGTADGIHAASELFEESSSTSADRVLVLLTDGRPCHLELGLPEAVEAGEALALDAAQEAADLGINIFVVEFAEATPGNNHLCMQPNSAFNLALADGFGFGVTTDDPADLEDKLAQVAKKMPARLVH